MTLVELLGKDQLDLAKALNRGGYFVKLWLEYNLQQVRSLGFFLCLLGLGDLAHL